MAQLVATGVVTINAAFLQEIKEVNEELRLLLKRTRYACSRPIALSGNCRQFVRLLSDLRDAIALHFSLEEAFGYFEDPIEVTTHIARMADQLRNEHRRLYAHFSALVERAESLLEDGSHALIAATIPGQFILFDAALQNHEARENELVLMAMDEDLGGGD